MNCILTRETANLNLQDKICAFVGIFQTVTENTLFQHLPETVFEVVCDKPLFKMCDTTCSS